MSKDDDDEGMQKLRAPPDFNGPTSERRCTDCLCTLLLVAMWGAMSAVGFYSVNNGDYRVILYPMDYDGNVCGISFNGTDMTDFPFIYYVNNIVGGVCVKECPNLENATDDGLTDIGTLVSFGGIFQAPFAEVDEDFLEVGDYANSPDVRECSEESCYPGFDPTQSWESEGINQGYGYATYLTDTYPILRRCYTNRDVADKLIDLTGQTNLTLFEQVSEGYDFWNNLYGDLWSARKYILGFGFGIALAISFTYAFLLRIPLVLTIMVWGSIFLTIGVFMVGGYFTGQQATKWEAEDPRTQTDRAINLIRIASYILWGIGGLIAFLGCCLRKQIMLALGCVKETSKAILRMPLLVLLPVVQAGGFVVFLVVWLTYAVYLASLGHITVKEFSFFGSPPITVRQYEFDDTVERSAWYLLFCFIWTTQFIIAAGEIIIAMSIAKWYFTRDKSKVGSQTVVASIYDTMYYHLGTAAYGSLILTIIKLFRWFLAKVQEKVKKTENKVAETLLCCCQCCLWCFEKCIRFLNKNAYIQTAIFGTSFCKSAREAFFLILRNAGRIGAITYVSSAVVFVGRLFIASVTTAIAFFVMADKIGDELYNLAGPAIFIFLIAYFVSDMFMNVFDMGIDTVLQCFVADEEMFDGDECYAEGALQNWIDKYEEN